MNTSYKFRTYSWILNVCSHSYDQESALLCVKDERLLSYSKDTVIDPAPGVTTRIPVHMQMIF
jgi:hypothetical protein